MSEPSHVHVVSLVLALSVVVGGWLLLDYSSRPSLQNASAPIDERATGADSSRQQPSTEAAATSPIDQRIFPTDMAVTFKCEKGGHVSFGDKPCDSNEKTVAVTAVQRERPAEQKNNLEQTKERAVTPQDGYSALLSAPEPLVCRRAAWRRKLLPYGLSGSTSSQLSVFALTER